eukprot:scaffold18599_cov27-Attheya_sp.AAC.3
MICKNDEDALRTEEKKQFLPDNKQELEEDDDSSSSVWSHSSGEKEEAYCAKEAVFPGIIVPSAREQWSTSRVTVLLVAKHPNVIDCLGVGLESSSSSQ